MPRELPRAARAAPRADALARRPRRALRAQRRARQRGARPRAADDRLRHPQERLARGFDGDWRACAAQAVLAAAVPRRRLGHGGLRRGRARRARAAAPRPPRPPRRATAPPLPGSATTRARSRAWRSRSGRARPSAWCRRAACAFTRRLRAPSSASGARSSACPCSRARARGGRVGRRALGRVGRARRARRARRGERRGQRGHGARGGRARRRRQLAHGRARHVVRALCRPLRDRARRRARRRRARAAAARGALRRRRARARRGRRLRVRARAATGAAARRRQADERAPVAEPARPSPRRPLVRLARAVALGRAGDTTARHDPPVDHRHAPTRARAGLRLANLPSPKGVEDFDQDADDEDAARLVAPIDGECRRRLGAVACAPCRGPVPALRL